jgi:PAS domain S-box-containing protein
MGSFFKELGGVEHVAEAHTLTLTTPSAPAGAEATEIAHGRRMVTEIAHRTDVERALRESLLRQRDIEGDLRAKEEQLEAVTNALPALMSFIDRDLRYVIVNDAYVRWFGVDREAIVGQPMRDVLGAAAFAALEPHIVRVLAGESVSFESSVPYQHGGTRFVEATYTPMRDRSGAVTGFTALVTDNTERRRLEQVRESIIARNGRLMRVTAAIADAVTEDQVYDAIAQGIGEAVGASGTALWRLDDAGEVATVVRAYGWMAARSMAVAPQRMRDAPPRPSIDAMRTRDPVWIDSRSELVTRYPHLAQIAGRERDYRSACLPLLAHGAVLGAISLTFDDTPDVPDERGFLMLVARYAGQALERLRLFDAERRVRAHAERTAARMSFLSRASRRFAESVTDSETLLNAVARDVTGDIADACAITLVNDAGRLGLVAAAHRRPEVEALMRSEIGVETLPISPDAAGSSHVAATAEPLLRVAIDPAQIASRAPPHARWVASYPPRSLIIAPMRARGRVVGTLAALRHEGTPDFNDEDLALLRELADRAGTAIDNSRLFFENGRGRVRAEQLYALARSVLTAKSVDDVYAAALVAVERATGAQRSAVLTYGDADSMRFRAWRGLSDGYRAAVVGHSPGARDARDPTPIVVADVEADPAWTAYRELFRSEGIRALGFIPLVSGGKLIGKFMVYFDRPQRIAAEELDSAAAIANNVAMTSAHFDAIDELRQTVHFNEMFTGILGHDLRNPLNAIMTAAHLVILRDDSERITKPVKRIMNSGRRMARMIDQLLDFTRLRVGEGIPLRRETCDVAVVARDVIDELADANAPCPIRFETKGETVGAFDPDRMSQVLSNLTANAVQHGTSEHGVTVRIDGADEERVRIEIHNMGAIDAALLPRLFEPMTGGERRRDKSQGLGLGLFISRQIVLSHGGDLTVTSSAAEGTRFMVVLPRARAQPEPVVLPAATTGADQASK